MRLTLEQDYAIRIVYTLCSADDILSVSELSQKTGVTPLFTQKIMRKLSQSNIVKSTKGIQGGYELQKQPEEISLYDIFESINGELNINMCLTSKYECTRPEVIQNGGECVIKKAISMLNNDIKESLKQITFKKLLTGGK